MYFQVRNILQYNLKHIFKFKNNIKSWNLSEITKKYSDKKVRIKISILIIFCEKTILFKTQIIKSTFSHFTPYD
jgi:putative IMPACT (imprinted ancient) family translation regulator